MSTRTFAIEGTRPRTYHESLSDVNGDERIRQRFFTSESEKGLIAGVSANIMFTIERPASAVWAVISDFNRWQNAFSHRYSGVVGELEGKTFGLRIGDHDNRPHYYEVVKVVPEYLLVINQPIPPDGTSAGFPGTGGVSPGFHVFMLSEYADSTTVTI